MCKRLSPLVILCVLLGSCGKSSSPDAIADDFIKALGEIPPIVSTANSQSTAEAAMDKLIDIEERIKALCERAKKSKPDSATRARVDAKVKAAVEKYRADIKTVMQTVSRDQKAGMFMSLSLMDMNRNMEEFPWGK